MALIALKGRTHNLQIKMGKGGVSSGFNYEKMYTDRLGHESSVSSGFKCKKGNGHTCWDTKIE